MAYTAIHFIPHFTRACYHKGSSVIDCCEIKSTVTFILHRELRILQVWALLSAGNGRRGEAGRQGSDEEYVDSDNMSVVSAMSEGSVAGGLEGKMLSTMLSILEKI